VTAAVRGKGAVVRAKAAGAMVIDGSVGAPCTTGIPEGAVHCTPAKYAADAASGGGWERFTQPHHPHTGAPNINYTQRTHHPHSLPISLSLLGRLEEVTACQSRC